MNGRRGGFFLRIVPALLYIAAIFYSGLVRVPSLKVPHGDKWAHAAAFGFMVIVLRGAISYELPQLSPRQVLVASVIGVAVLGGLLEILQMFTATRSAELLDWAADIAGAVLVALLIDRLVLASSSSAS